MKLRKVSPTQDILLSEEVQRSRNRPQILVGSKVYYRFMDVLYVPDHVFKLPPTFVAELNRVRDELSGVVIDHDYNAAVYQALIEAVRQAVPAARTVLDFGCGMGAAGPFIHSVFPNVRLHGYDIRSLSEQYPYVEISSGEAHSTLPYPDASFDACFAFFVLHFHVLDFQLDEIWRALRPRGALAFNLINSADYEVLDRIHERGFSLRADIEISAPGNTGRGFVFLKDASNGTPPGDA